MAEYHRLKNRDLHMNLHPSHLIWWRLYVSGLEQLPDKEYSKLDLIYTRGRYYVIKKIQKWKLVLTRALLHKVFASIRGKYGFLQQIFLIRYTLMASPRPHDFPNKKFVGEIDISPGGPDRS